MQGVNERPLRQKIYVPVTVDFDEEGKMRPTDIYWMDGQTYHIDRVLKVRQAAAMRSGGQGDRYTVVINGWESYLYFERSTAISGPRLGKWFVERK